jgi:hypothetical protein
MVSSSAKNVQKPLEEDIDPTAQKQATSQQDVDTQDARTRLW